jgi:glycine/D-amino acid oxidase-like deaminating enzyme
MAREPIPLPASADVVIVGGGVMGCSAAFHLAEAGVGVVLIERGELGSGSTSRAAGGVRTQFSDALNIEIAKRSLQAYKRFDRRPGWEIDYDEIGYLFLLTTEAEVEAFTRSVALQNELGVPSRMITPAEAREISPLIAGQDILAASYCPTDAHATPESVVQGYASGAR